MKQLDKKELKEIIQSGHINLLVGSGCSRPYLSTLGGIEQRMNDEPTREEAQKEYFRLIKKSKSVLNENLETDADEKKALQSTKQQYDNFITLWTEALFKRSLGIVNKQVNLFTTNFDLFLEDACERLRVPYNDGFSGQLNPKFSVANFNRIQKYKSLQFDNTSDIPLFNIIKLHGSLSWKTDNNMITYSNGSHIEDDLDSKDDEEFQEAYGSQLAVINPTAEKHFETVLDTNYASMLRKFTLELEKENSVLLVFGFSLDDRHIKDLLYGVMKSNPTLIVVYFSRSPYDSVADNKDEAKNANLYIVAPEEGDLPFTKSIDFMKSVLFNTRDEPEAVAEETEINQDEEE